MPGAIDSTDPFAVVHVAQYNDAQGQWLPVHSNQPTGADSQTLLFDLFPTRNSISGRRSLRSASVPMEIFTGVRLKYFGVESVPNLMELPPAYLTARTSRLSHSGVAMTVAVTTLLIFTLLCAVGLQQARRQQGTLFDPAAFNVITGPPTTKHWLTLNCQDIWTSASEAAIEANSVSYLQMGHSYSFATLALNAARQEDPSA